MSSHTKTSGYAEWPDSGRSYDVLASQTLDALPAFVEHGPDCPKSCTLFNHDPFETLKEVHAQNAVLERFWTEITTVPVWVDWKQIERGQQVFHRFAIAILTGFAFQGFVGQIAISPGPAEVLVRTGGLSTTSLIGRLRRTLAWYVAVTYSLDSIRSGGQGHRATVRVRLMHAKVRDSLRETIDEDDSAPTRVPLSTSDSILTMTFFCCNPMWLYLPQLGIFPTVQEIDDFVALHRYLAHLLGVPGDSFATSDQAKTTMEHFLESRHAPAEASKKIAHAFVERLAKEIPLKRDISVGFVQASCRAFNSPAVCDQLDLGHPGNGYYIPILTARWLLRMVAVGQRKCSLLDRWIVDRNRKLLKRTVDAKDRTDGGFEQRNPATVPFRTRHLYLSLRRIVPDIALCSWLVALLAIAAAVSFML